MVGGYFDLNSDQQPQFPQPQPEGEFSSLPGFDDESNSKQQEQQQQQEEEEEGEFKEPTPKKSKAKPWEQQSDAYAESFPSAREFSFTEAYQELVDDGKDRRFAGQSGKPQQEGAKGKGGGQQTQRPKDYLVKKEKKGHKIKSDNFYDGQLQKIEKEIDKKKESGKTPAPEGAGKKRDLSVLDPSQTPLAKKQRT